MFKKYQVYEKSELEHVTSYFYNNVTKFTIKNFTNINKGKKFKVLSIQLMILKIKTSYKKMNIKAAVIGTV